MSATLTVHSVASHDCAACNRRTMHQVTTTETQQTRVCQRYVAGDRCNATEKDDRV